MIELNGETKSPLRIGFIGGSTASAVGYTHRVSCQLDGRWQLASGCFSRDPERSLHTGKSWHLPENLIYSDWRLYISEQRDAVDAVAVLTPTPDHAEIVCALLEAGVPVICEKAMAASLSQSGQIRETLERTRGFLAVTFNYSGYPLLRDLRRHVAEGELGRLTQIHIEMPSDAFIQSEERMNPQPWRLQDGEIPTILLDLAVHLHHLTGFLTDLAPTAVNADFNHFSIFDGLVDDAHLWVEYGANFRASFWVSKAALGHRNGLRVRLFGDQKSAEWYQEEPERLHIYQKDSTRLTYDRGNTRHPDEIRERFKPGHPAGFVEAFANLYADIADALEQYRERGDYDSAYVYGWSQADQGLRLLNAAAESNRKRCWVAL